MFFPKEIQMVSWLWHQGTEMLCKRKGQGDESNRSNGMFGDLVARVEMLAEFVDQKWAYKVSEWSNDQPATVWRCVHI